MRQAIPGLPHSCIEWQWQNHKWEGVMVSKDGMERQFCEINEDWTRISITLDHGDYFLCESPGQHPQRRVMKQSP